MSSLVLRGVTRALVRAPSTKMTAIRSFTTTKKKKKFTIDDIPTDDSEPTRNMDEIDMTTRTVLPGVVSPSRYVPDRIITPPYVKGIEFDENPTEIICHDKQAQELMRQSCQLAHRTLMEAKRVVAPGVTTDEIDRVVHEFVISNDAYPSPLGYKNFPKSCCTSINEILCHGIPDSRPLQIGDIINVDVSVYLNGYHGDCSATFAVGAISESNKTLMKVTYEAMMSSIALCGPGVPFNVIGKNISMIAEKHGYHVPPYFASHGIGRDFHMAPLIPHFYIPDFEDVMLPGCTFTIEPLICEKDKDTYLWEDSWTFVNWMHGMSAQYENTVLITKNGVEIITTS